MKVKRRHKEDTRMFAELTRREQVLSLNATISYVGRAIRYHLDHVDASSRARRRTVLAAQIERLLARVQR